MGKIIDNWFMQNDVRSRIDKHMNFSEKYTLIYESIDNALEHFIYYSIPIPTKKISSSIKKETWGEDTYLTKRKILLLKENHYLSISFRRHFNISLWSKKYFSESNKMIGKMDVDKNKWSKSKKCYILTDTLKEFLQYTNQILIFGISSRRYSERELKEFRLSTFGEKCKSDTKNYSFWFQEVKDRNSISHSQIKSMSIVFGKYYVPVN